MQAVLVIDSLPEGAVDAARAFFDQHLDDVQTALEGDTAALAIVLPTAPKDHDDWRRAAARDLARAHAPKRVNVVGTSVETRRETMLAYLGDAPGVTGQYLAGHEPRT